MKLAAAEAALRERDEREREEQAARASSEHAGVMHEADRLGDEMKGALGNVKAFMRRAWTGAGQTASSETDDVTAGNRTPERRATNARDGPHTPSSAMRSKAKTSIVEKPAARGAYLRAGGDSPGGDSSLVGRQRPKTVAFVGDREQRRLEREGEVVADNARLRRTVGELEQRLKRLARVARRATDAAELEIELNDRHFIVLEFMRKEFAANGTAPSLRKIKNDSGVGTKELYQLFPKGPAKKAARIAGLGKPEGCI